MGGTMTSAMKRGSVDELGSNSKRRKNVRFQEKEGNIEEEKNEEEK